MLTVRNGKKVVPTCTDCGCRLNIVTFEDTTFAHHFVHPFKLDRDAKEHSCVSIGKVWTVSTKGLYNEQRA